LIHERWPGEPAAALGCSMGAAALCFASAQVQDWQAIVLEALYSEVGTAFQRRIGSAYPAWFAQLYPGIVRITERRLKIRIHELAPIQHIANFSSVPILFIAGSEDTFAPPSDSDQIRSRYPGPHEFWQVPEASHSDIWEKGGEEYRKRVGEFLEKWVRM
jgi:pimeloyl-ACP methyl ester carboxylesterase